MLWGIGYLISTFLVTISFESPFQPEINCKLFTGNIPFPLLNVLVKLNACRSVKLLKMFLFHHTLHKNKKRLVFSHHFNLIRNYSTSWSTLLNIVTEILSPEEEFYKSVARCFSRRDFLIKLNFTLLLYYVDMHITV